MTQVLLRVDGEVQRPLTLSFEDLAAIPEQFPDVGRVVAGRKGDAVPLEALMILAGAKPAASYLTLHATRDNFHASVPLSAVRVAGLLVYRLDGQSLPEKSGGPIRFLVPEAAVCQCAEVDECANVKYVDRIELTATRGYDNRPVDDKAHAELHARKAK
jgi:DMSO/TMAO reductase YedYZ molybdopterin-dependent catalytic subunit